MQLDKNVTFVPYGDNEKPHELPVSRYLSTTPTSIVAHLAPPHTGQVLKMFLCDKEDYSAAYTLTLLQNPLCSNFPKLYYWSRIQSPDDLDARSTDNVYAYRHQLGAPMSTVFSLMCDSEQLRVLMFQLTLPLVCMHYRGLLHADVKMENYVNAIRAYDPGWTERTTFTVGGNTFDVPTSVGGLEIKPLLIDFELTMLIRHAKLKTFMVTSLHARPPELLFVDPKAPLYYSAYSEAFSLAMGVLYELRLRKDFMPRPSEISPEYMMDAVTCIGTLSGSGASTSVTVAYTHDDVDLIAKYAWLVVHTLGYPGDEEMNKTPLGRIIRCHKDSIMTHPRYNFLENMPEHIRCLLGSTGIAFMRNALKWNPAKRKTLVQLMGHPYFRPLIVKKQAKRKLHI